MSTSGAQWRMRLATLLATVAAAGLLAAYPVQATPPSSTILRFDDTFTNTFDCPFPIETRFVGALKDTLYFDNEGNLVKEILTPQYQGRTTVTWTNPATGKSLSSGHSSQLTIYYNPDGSFRAATNQGLTFHVSIPGEGTVLIDVGRIVIRRGQGIVFEAGPHQELHGDTAEFCAALS